MVERTAASIIVFGSSLLFVYWFRYACLLLLTAKPARDYGAVAAIANQLSFPRVQTILQRPMTTDLGELRRLLDRDYQVVAYLLRHIATPFEGVAAIEKRMLEVDYWLARIWYRASLPFSHGAACRALQEMSSVVAHFANAVGERIADA